MSEKSIKLKIGNKKYDIISDDDYLPQMRSGLKSWLINLAKILLQRNGFEPKMVRLFQTLIKDSDTVIDIGANIGCTSLLFGELAQQVVSFEPSPSTFALLSQNIARSQLPNIELYNCALGSSKMTSQITYAKSNRSGGFVANKTTIKIDHITEKIQVEKLDNLIQELNINQVDFIKIDVEGFELEVIKGAIEVITKFQPIVVLELNHWCLNALQRISVPDFLDYLLSIFPILYAIEDGNYADLHDEDYRYKVMYNHIINFKFSNLVAAFRVCS